MMAEADQKVLIAKDPRYGRVICRCETITEGEIVDAIHRPVGARTVDGVKRARVPAWAAARVASADLVLHRFCPVN